MQVFEAIIVDVHLLFCFVFSHAAGILLNASTSPDENDSIDIEMQCDMLFIVSSLCDGDTHRKVILPGENIASKSSEDNSNTEIGMSSFISTDQPSSCH